ncbi:MAG: phosphoesterase [Planctomycetes bacterium]|nr:phosphoesterase [Planctomycetota bacterium]
MDADKARELVLVIPEQRFREAGFFTGFRAFDPNYLAILLDPAYLSYRPRGEVETDPSFKQLIPYVVLCCRGEIFHYKRGSSGGEKRLQALRSVGIGGHINPEDGPASSEPYRAGMIRELNEEVAIPSAYSEMCIGFIFDPSTPVGEVHLGVVHQFEVESPSARPRESAIAEAGFAPLSELLTSRSQFETWSQLTLDELQRESSR